MDETIKDRTIKFVKFKKLQMKEFERMCGLSSGYVTSMRKGYGSDKLKNVLAAFPELNREWLLYGEGEMLKPTDGAAPGDRAEASGVGQGGTPLDRLTEKTDRLTDKTDRLMSMMEKLIEQERMNAEANLRNAKANEVNAEAARINADNLRQLIAMLGSAQQGGCEGAEMQQPHLRAAQSVG